MPIRMALAWIALAAIATNATAQTAPSVASSTEPTAAHEQADLATSRGDDDPLDSTHWRERIAEAQRRHQEWLAHIAAKGPEYSRTAKPDPMEPLLNDETLSRGDIVSTPKGLRVFRGSPGLPHHLGDFN